MAAARRYASRPARATFASNSAKQTNSPGKPGLFSLSRRRCESIRLLLRSRLTLHRFGCGLRLRRGFGGRLLVLRSGFAGSGRLCLAGPCRGRLSWSRRFCLWTFPRFHMLRLRLGLFRLRAFRLGWFLGGRLLLGWLGRRGFSRCHRLGSGRFASGGNRLGLRRRHPGRGRGSLGRGSPRRRRTTARTRPSSKTNS